MLTIIVGLIIIVIYPFLEVIKILIKVIPKSMGHCCLCKEFYGR